MKIADALKGNPRPALDKLVKTLEKLPADEVFTTEQISKLSKVSVSHNRTEAVLEGFRVRTGRAVYWGCAKAIKAFKAARDAQ